MRYFRASSLRGKRFCGVREQRNAARKMERVKEGGREGRILARKFTSRAEKPLGTQKLSNFALLIGQSARRSRRVTLSSSYMKWFNSLMDLVVWTVQREDSRGEEKRFNDVEEITANRNMGVRKVLFNLFSPRILRRYIANLYGKRYFQNFLL